VGKPDELVKARHVAPSDPQPPVAFMKIFFLRSVWYG